METISDFTNDSIDLTKDLLAPMSTVERTIQITPFNGRWENDAEHSFLLASLGCAIAQDVDPTLDLGKIAQYALVHDIVEVFAGDTTIWASEQRKNSKVAREASALQTITQRFATFPWIAHTIHQYEQFADAESCFVYALDKIIPYVVMLAVDHQPFPPTPAVHEEKMQIARTKIAKYPKLLAYFEECKKQYDTRAHLFAK